MMPPTPPSLGNQAFNNNAYSRVFMLNGCSYEGYYNSSSWNNYRNRLREPVIDINVTVLTSDLDYGTASAILSTNNQTVRCDSTVVVQATANYGYRFDHWSNGSTGNPDTITLTGDSTITAYFDRNSYNLTVNVNDTSFGSVALPQGSNAFYQDTLMVVAYPKAHHHVINWQGQDIVAISAHKDTAWVKMDNDDTLTCNIAIDTHTVMVQTNNTTRGMVEASGTEFAYGTPCTVTATAYTGNIFTGWSNGETANPYTFAVISNVALTAMFVDESEMMYTVTLESADSTMGTVSGGGQALNGNTVTIIAIPNDGYRFLNWNDGNTENPRMVTVTGNITYTAYFESTQGIRDIDDSKIKIYATDGRIVVQGAEGLEIRVHDLVGREVMKATPNGETSVLPTGVYLVKVGTLPAKKVVVMR
jgi:hypothetical protein